MGYTDIVKKQILSQKIKSLCCRRAFVCGLLLDRIFDCNGNENIKFRLGDESNLSACAELLSKHFRVELEVVAGIVCGRKEYAVYLPSCVFEKLIGAQGLENLRREGSPEDTLSLFEFRCPQCIQAFLGGAFIAYATVQNPQTGANLEFNLKNQRSIILLRSVISSQGLTPQGKNRLYFKKADQISSFLATIGAKKLSFDLMNLQIERDIRNYENRVTNCLTRNITRSISASMIQIDAITSIMTQGTFESLADELKETARLRLDNPDVSLTELAGMHEPPITKSGLSHRLAKLVEISKAKQ